MQYHVMSSYSICDSVLSATTVTLDVDTRPVLIMKFQCFVDKNFIGASCLLFYWNTKTSTVIEPTIKKIHYNI